MATKTTTSTPDLSGLAQQAREQLLSTVEQTQQATLKTAQTWVDALSVPQLRELPGLDAAGRYAFDVATDLLAAQRTFTEQLTGVLSSAKPV